MGRMKPRLVVIGVAAGHPHVRGDNPACLFLLMASRANWALNVPSYFFLMLLNQSLVVIPLISTSPRLAFPP